MRETINKILCVVMTSVLLAGIPWQLALAQQKAESKSKEPPPVVDAKTGKILNEAIELLNNEKFEDAKRTLSGLKLDTLSPYERSRVEQIYASIEHSQGNYDKARSHFQAAIAAGGLNEQETKEIKYFIAQLYISEERWKEGAAALEEWFKSTDKPNSAAYYLLAISYYQMGDFVKATAPAQKAVELSEKPQETFLQLLMSLYMEREQYTAAIPLLEQLIALVPEKKTYWLTLSSIYGDKEDYDNALVMMEVPFNAGLLSDASEYHRLADLLMVAGIPYRATQVLTKAAKDKKVVEDQKYYEKLANAWIAAREFDEAAGPLQRAAQISNNGNIYVRLGEVHVQRENWDDAASAFQNALNKGGLKETGYANLMLGISLYNQKKYSEALSAFRRAQSSPKERKSADGYISLIQSNQG
ncbi:MAG: TPR REGION protein [Gammaproteobacteria bacterium]|nr:TPR REGION protein [Gammaproteobacteria bacterium]